MADSITELRAQKERLKSQLSRFKQESRRVGKLATQGVLMAAGGAGAGVVRAKLPNIPGTEIPTDAALGITLTALAAFDAFGDLNEEVLAFGGGMLAVGAAELTQKALA